MGPQPSIHINIDQPRAYSDRPPSPSVSEEDEDGVQVSPDQISPDYSVVHANTASQSGSSQQEDPFLPLPYPQELISEPDVHPYQITRAGPRSRQRSETSREGSIQRDSSRRLSQLQGPHHPRQRTRHSSHPRPDSIGDSDSTEAFLIQSDPPEYGYRMGREKPYYEQSGYTHHSSSSGGYSYPNVPAQHSHHVVPYGAAPGPQSMLPYQAPPPPAMAAPYGYPAPQPAHPPPHQYPPHMSPHGHHPHSQMASPYAQSPYGAPSVIQYQQPQSYFPSQFQQFPPQHPYYMQQMQQYAAMNGMSAVPPYMHYSPPPRESPQPAVASPAPAPKPEVSEQALMARMEALILADRAERDKKEDERLKAIQSAEERAAAIAQAEKDRREEEKKIRADALKAAEEEAERYRKMQQERAEEEKRIRLEALRAAEEEAILARKRDAERRAEEARIREEARKEAIEAEKARIAAEAERAAYEQRIRKEAAEQALAAAAADLKAKQEQADREAKIAADAADAAKNSAEKAAKDIAEAAEKAAKESAASAEAAAKLAKDEHDAKLKEAEANVEAAKKLAEAAEEKAKANAPPEKKAPVRFKDALGRSYNFPWDRCHKWDDMEGLIHQAFAHIDKIGPHVLQNHYDLIGPDKEIIMPEYWEDSIGPGMQITMMLWPIPEPEPEPELDPLLAYDPEPLPPFGPGDDMIDLDAILNGTKKPTKPSKRKSFNGRQPSPAKSVTAKAAAKRPGGFASWMLGGQSNNKGKAPLKGNKKPTIVTV